MVAPAIIAAGISAGGSLLSGLFGGGGETENTVNYKKMVRAASEAGFNPLTALRNGGAAGFTTTHHPALSAGAAVGQALGTFGNFMANFDPMADARRELEYSFVQAQLENLQADTALKQKASIGGVPTYASGQYYRRMGSPAMAVTGQPTQPEPGEVTVTNPHREALVDPNQRDAEAYTTRYGESEAAETAVGATIAWRDLIFNYPVLGVRHPMDGVVDQVYRYGKRLWDAPKPWAGAGDPSSPNYIPPALHASPWQ